MSKRKLLLADDSVTIQKVVNLTFADEGIEVVSVGDGDTAMQKFVESTPDLVLADVNMPGTDGYRICEMIKGDDETRHIPVILLVGSFEPFDEDEARRVGADAFLTKPFQSIRQLVTKVSDLLGISSEAENSVSTAAAAVAGNSVSAGAETQEAAAGDADADADLHFADTFAETQELPREEERSRPNLGDAGMDDEMIETSHFGTTQDDDVQKFISDSYSYDENAPAAEDDAPLYNDYDAPEQMSDDDLEFAETQPIGADELEPVGDENFAVEPEPSEKAIYDFGDSEQTGEVSEVESFAPYTETAVDTGTAQTAEITENAETSVGAEPPRDDREYFEPEEADRSEEFSTQRAETFEDRFAPAVTEEFARPEIAAETETAAENAEETGGFNAPESEREAQAEEVPQPEAASALAFDETDLLELPPLVEETGIRPQTFRHDVKTETTEMAEAAEPNHETAEAPSAVEIAAAPAFPPELIEAIAQRVAEKISGRAIKEIAAQIAPQVSDLIAQEMAKETSKED